MGGIAIIVDPQLPQADREACVRRMLHATTNGEGPRVLIATFGPCTLGAMPAPGVEQHENQPWMASSRQGTHHAVVCGETAPPPDLAAELSSHQVPTGDLGMAGLVCEAFSLWGAASLRRFHGGHALAVWSHETQQLLIARDTLGLRGVFFSQRGQRLVAASELRAICASGLVTTELSPASIVDCVVHGAPVAPRTIFEHVHALRPGECIRWQSDEVEVSTYWSFRDFHDGQGSVGVNKEEFLSEFRMRLQSSLRRAVGTGMLTACGVGNDLASCLLVGSASRVTPVTLRTFSLCYVDEMHHGPDEGPRMARHFGTRHESVLIDGDEVSRDLDAILAAYDQPGEEALVSFYLSRAAAQAGLSALLSPLGSEAVFGVQDWFRGPAGESRKRPGLLRSWWSRVLGLPSDTRRSLGALRGVGGSLHEVAALQRRWVSEVERESWLAKPGAFHPHHELALLSREVVQEHPELVAGAWDLRTRLTAQTVPSHRQAASLHEVSVAFPFLDQELLSWCRAHPGAAKAAFGSDGGLPATWSDLLLSDLKLRPRAHAEPPYARWWHGPLRAFGESTFSEPSLAKSGYFHAPSLRLRWQAALAGASDDWQQLWRLAVLINFVNRRHSH